MRRNLICRAIVDRQRKLNPAIGRLREDKLARADYILTLGVEECALVLGVYHHGALLSTAILSSSPVTHGNGNLTLVVITLLEVGA